MKILDQRSARHWQLKHDPRAPKVGDIAPDFELRDANRQNPVCLSDYRQPRLHRLANTVSI